MNNPVIFLVEDIVDNSPITLIEKYLPNLTRANLYLREIPNALASQPPEYIKFVKMKDFIIDVKNSQFPKNQKVFYFISNIHSITLFSIYFFSVLDKEVLDFLSLYKIGIIIDSSIENTNIIEHSRTIFDNTLSEINKNRVYEIFSGIFDLPIYLVSGGEYTQATCTTSMPNIHIKSFPGAFFHLIYPGTKLYQEALEKKNFIFNNIENKIISDQTPIWQAFSREPRVTRIIFQLIAERNGLTKFGKYSRLLPCKEFFQHRITQFNLENYGFYRDSEELNILDNIINIENFNEFEIKRRQELQISDLILTDSLIHISLETSLIRSIDDLLNLGTHLTEKTACPIISGIPFIMLGGCNKKILDKLGFTDYNQIESMDIPNYFDSLDYINNTLISINQLSVEDKQKLYDSWKENLKYNFNHYFQINIQQKYLEFLGIED